MTPSGTDLVPPGVVGVRADNPGPMTLDGTNTWVVVTAAGAVVVDPGPLDRAHLDAVVTACGGPVAAVLLTHRHADHAEGADALARAVGAPVRAVDPTLCSRGAAALADGESVGPLRVLRTPGHTSDSTCLVLGAGAGRSPAAVLTGDTILGRGTSVVAHPDGRLGDYLASLRALRALADAEGDMPVLPGHGPALPSLAAVVDSYLAHRQRRLAEVRAAVAAGHASPAAVVDLVYADVPVEVRAAAEASVAAQLAHLADLARGADLAHSADPAGPGYATRSGGAA